MSPPTGCEARLINLPSANLQFRTDAKCVVLAASVAQCLELDVQRKVAVSHFVTEQSWRTRGVHQQDILVAIVIEVGDRDRCPAGRARGSGNQSRTVEKLSRPVVPKKKHTW
jgi:hypothetical protein